MTKTRIRRLILVSVCIPSVLAVGAAQAVTIATFADPTIGGPPTPMFSVQDTAPGFGAIVGGWAGSNLNLQVASTTYNDAKFTFGVLPYIGTFSNGSLGAGQFDFLDSSNNLILKVQFDSATVNIGGAAGDNIFSNNNVQFSGPAVASLGILGQESFAFSFSNQQPIYNGGGAIIGFTSTASYTSSAHVPEPSTMAVLGIGMVLLAIRRRR